MKNWVSAAALGCGRIYNDGHRDAYVNKYSDNVVLIALCDLREDLVSEQLKWIKKKYEKKYKKLKKKDPEAAEKYKFALERLQGYTDYQKMFDALEGELDLVDNCTPGFGHIEYSIDAMQHGFHVCAEKPPGLNWWDVKRIIKVEKETGKFYQLNENVCYERPVIKAREVIQSGKLGKIFSVKIRFGHNGPYIPYHLGESGLPHFIDPLLSGGGCLQDLAPHGISKAFYPIYQEGAHVISCKTRVLERRKNPRIMSSKPFESPVDDWAEAELQIYDPRTDSSYTMEVTTSWCGSFSDPLVIEGEKGTLTIGRIPNSKDYGVIITPRDKQEKPEYYPADKDKWEPHKSHTREIQIFCDNILKGRPSETDGTYATRLQELISIQYFSKLKGKEVTLEEMEAFGKELEEKYKDEKVVINEITKQFISAIDLK